MRAERVSSTVLTQESALRCFYQSFVKQAGFEEYLPAFNARALNVFSCSVQPLSPSPPPTPVLASRGDSEFPDSSVCVYVYVYVYF